MAYKILLSYIFFLLVLSTRGFAKRNIPNSKTSSFEFIKNLKGCHKGNNTKDIYLLKTYLHKFGYLNLNQTQSNNYFDRSLEEAVKSYQRNFNVEPTGIINDETVSKMITPRCGVADIINGTNFMQTSKQNHESHSKFHTVSHYTFFRGNPRWPSSQTHLTYGFLTNTPTGAIGPVTRAFNQWASATHFTFSQTNDAQNVDMVIGFFRGDHGDDAGQTTFNGPGDILAHAFAPTDGRLHFDADEPWSVQPARNAFHLETVALHEIGHLLGLDHSSVEEAIMYPTLNLGQTKNLGADDVNGIRALYNV